MAASTFFPFADEYVTKMLTWRDYRAFDRDVNNREPTRVVYDDYDVQKLYVFFYSSPSSPSYGDKGSGVAGMTDVKLTVNNKEEVIVDSFADSSSIECTIPIVAKGCPSGKDWEYRVILSGGESMNLANVQCYDVSRFAVANEPMSIDIQGVVGAPSGTSTRVKFVVESLKRAIRVSHPSGKEKFYPLSKEL